MTEKPEIATSTSEKLHSSAIAIASEMPWASHARRSELVQEFVALLNAGDREAIAMLEDAIADGDR